MTSMIFHFRALSADDEEFMRDYEIPYDATLTDFHNLISEDLGLDKNEIVSFFLSNEDWEKLAEFTRIDMGLEDEDADDDLIPLCMDKVTLGRIIHEKHQRLIYVYDILNDSSLFITLMESKKSKEGEKYPKVTGSKGKAPKKKTPKENDESLFAQESAFKDIMEDFEDEFDEFGDEFASFDEEDYY